MLRPALRSVARLTPPAALLAALALVLLALARPAAAHDPLLDLPPPRSSAEAWDVIRQSVDNVGKLIETNQLKPVAAHVANCSPAVRALQAELAGRPDADALRRQLEAMYDAGGAVIVATRDKSRPRVLAAEQYKRYRAAWDAIAARYPPGVRDSAVYACPMHPLDRHTDPADRCAICQMSLVRRRIPTGSAYDVPGQPSMTMRATVVGPAAAVAAAAAGGPFRHGERVEVRVVLERRDGSPVLHGDLLTMHTEKIHLLIVDPTLGDYHHEHPAPTDVPGEYAFAFTPRRPGPYRVFADVVPAATGVQEYVVADVPPVAPAPRPAGARPTTPPPTAAAAAPPPARAAVDDRTDRREVTLDGLRFQLSFGSGGSANTSGRPAGGPAGSASRPATAVRAREPVEAEVLITGPDGRPFAALEPVMGAFAHVVGFADDYRTVVHIHPRGPEPAGPAERGGPALRFIVYAPAAGYYRLYVQVRVGGTDRFAPLGLNVGPARPDGTLND